MKILLKFMLVSFFALLVTAGFAQEDMIVAADQNLEDGKFDQYSTFTFAKQIQDDADTRFFWESESMKGILKEEIRSSMQAMDYKFVEGPNADADLIVNFQVLKEDTDLTGWENVERETGYWGFGIDAQDRDWEDKTNYNVEKGTILINIADAEQGIEVWKGFASGVIDDAELTEGDEVKIGEAVERIFENYYHTASR